MKHEEYNKPHSMEAYKDSWNFGMHFSSIDSNFDILDNDFV